MKTYSVVTTPMQSHISIPSIFWTQHNMDYATAKQRFIEASDKFNLDNKEYGATGGEAGGIGYDYRVEFFESAY